MCSLGSQGAADNTIELLVGNALDGKLHVLTVATMLDHSPFGDPKEALPVSVRVNSTVASGIVSLGADVSYLGRGLLGRGVLHDPVVAAGAPLLGEVVILALTKDKQSGAWTSRSIVSIQSPYESMQGPGDSFGAACEYLGPVRAQSQSIATAHHEVSMVIGAPDWSDSRQDGRTFGAIVLVHLAARQQREHEPRVLLSVTDQVLISPARMPLRLNGHWPSQFE